jgi:hypothetical protein
MNPSLLKRFVKKLTRERVVPIISANIAWLILGITFSGLLSLPNCASKKRSGSLKELQAEIKAQKPLPLPSSPEFKSWFGDSKVVDKDGNPLRVYHGTTRTFTEFGAGGELSPLGWHYVNDNPKFAEKYALSGQPILSSTKATIEGGQRETHTSFDFGSAERPGSLAEVKADAAALQSRDVVPVVHAVVHCPMRGVLRATCPGLYTQHTLSRLLYTQRHPGTPAAIMQHPTQPQPAVPRPSCPCRGCPG